MKVSVVVPSKNEERDIKDCAESISKQDYENFEFIVVDGNSKDRTREVAREYGARVILEKPAISPANARNIGAKAAKGDIILFADSDNVLPKDHVRKVARAFKKDVDAVCTYTAAYKPNFIAKCFFQERAAVYPKDDISGLMPNAWRKKVFLELGGYNPKLGYGEDKELNKRAVKRGINKIFRRDIVIHHKEPSTWGRIYREGRWWGRTLPSYMKTDPKRGTLILAAVLFRAFAIPLALLLYLFGAFLQSVLIGLLYTLYYLYYLVKSMREHPSFYAFIMPFFKSLRNVFVFIGICEAILKTALGVKYSKGE